MFESVNGFAIGGCAGFAQHLGAGLRMTVSSLKSGVSISVGPSHHFADTMRSGEEDVCYQR
ncbi:MAG: hypothetical protein DRJ28_05170 [Actinobacteria bacterium]|nr:MAG: hypothetical protein DRJ28_05170 [Actinomycetota bacterium]